MDGGLSMIKSMTGFGHGEIQENDRKFTVEIKAVNHRYFDAGIKMPKKFSYFEASIRNTLKQYMQRGKVDVFVTYEDFSELNVSLKYNETVAAQYLNYYRQMAETFGLRDDISVSALGRCPDVFTLEEKSDDDETLWASLQKALVMACEQFVETRQREGESLKADLLEKLDHMGKNVDRVEQRYPQIVEEYTNRLHEKVRELLGDTQIDESRIATELVLFSDKICTDEETVRLRSHISSMRDSLIEGGSIGRKLDFIAQEMNREANTILSKANDLETSDIAIDLKTEIEKIREQIQNIE